MCLVDIEVGALWIFWAVSDSARFNRERGLQRH